MSGAESYVHTNISTLFDFIFVFIFSSICTHITTYTTHPIPVWKETKKRGKKIYENIILHAGRILCCSSVELMLFGTWYDGTYCILACVYWAEYLNPRTRTDVCIAGTGILVRSWSGHGVTQNARNTQRMCSSRVDRKVQTGRGADVLRLKRLLLDFDKVFWRYTDLISQRIHYLLHVHCSVWVAMIKRR